MRFRPCIDIHNGKVKQIVGGSLQDEGDCARENFASDREAADFARLYQKDGLAGGHVILLNPASSPYYPETRRQALSALAASYLEGWVALVPSLFVSGAAIFLALMLAKMKKAAVFLAPACQIRWENLERLRQAVGKERIVIDVSCRKREDAYYIVTDRWQKFTDVKLTEAILEKLGRSCDEFLVHGVDVEGKASGVEEDLVRLLGGFSGIPVTYAGGIGSMADLERFRKISGGKLDFTIGSALDLFGGSLPYDVVRMYR